MKSRCGALVTARGTLHRVSERRPPSAPSPILLAHASRAAISFMPEPRFHDAPNPSAEKGYSFGLPLRKLGFQRFAGLTVDGRQRPKGVLVQYMDA